MAQIIRMYKFEVPVLIRVYGNHGHCQRRQLNHYEVLRISPNATDKEIRNAYITLSKKMHPDSGNEGNHADFVKINEAYSVLSKKDKKQQYDLTLEENRHKIHYHRNSPNHVEHTGIYYAYKDFYKSTEGYVRPSNITLRKGFLMCILIVLVGIIIQLIFITIYKSFNRHLMELSKQRRLEYEKIKRDAKGLTVEEQNKRVLEISKFYGFHPDD